MGKAKTAGIVVGAILAVIIIGGIAASSLRSAPATTSIQSEPQNTVSDTSTTPPRADTIDNVAIQITNYTKVQHLPYFTSSGVFLTVHMTLENKGAQPFETSLYYFRLVDSQGRTYAESNAGNAYNDWIAGKTINPGLKINGTVVYDVPKDQPATDYKLTVTRYGEIQPAYTIALGQH